jgi:hypothetical protein
MAQQLLHLAQRGTLGVLRQEAAGAEDIERGLAEPLLQLRWKQLTATPVFVAVQITYANGPSDATLSDEARAS